jgi:hypothetical protein
MYPLQVKARKQSDTAIWYVIQDSINLAHMCGLTFRNRKSLKHSVLSMTYLCYPKGGQEEGGN